MISEPVLELQCSVDCMMIDTEISMQYISVRTTACMIWKYTKNPRQQSIYEQWQQNMLSTGGQQA